MMESTRECHRLQASLDEAEVRTNELMSQNASLLRRFSRNFSSLVRHAFMRKELRLAGRGIQYWSQCAKEWATFKFKLPLRQMQIKTGIVLLSNLVWTGRISLRASIFAMWQMLLSEARSRKVKTQYQSEVGDVKKMVGIGRLESVGRQLQLRPVRDIFSEWKIFVVESAKDRFRSNLSNKDKDSEILAVGIRFQCAMAFIGTLEKKYSGVNLFRIFSLWKAEMVLKKEEMLRGDVTIAVLKKTIGRALEGWVRADIFYAMTGWKSIMQKKVKEETVIISQGKEIDAKKVAQLTSGNKRAAMSRMAWIGKAMLYEGARHCWSEWVWCVRGGTEEKHKKKVEESVLSEKRQAHLLNLLKVPTKGRTEMFFHWKQTVILSQNNRSNEEAGRDIARLLHDKAMLMRMTRELGLQLVQATRDMAEMDDQGEIVSACIEDKKLLCEELMYCEDLLLTTREQVVAYRAQAKGNTASPFKLLFG